MGGAGVGWEEEEVGEGLGSSEEEEEGRESRVNK